MLLSRLISLKMSISFPFICRRSFRSLLLSSKHISSLFSPPIFNCSSMISLILFSYCLLYSSKHSLVRFSLEICLIFWSLISSSTLNIPRDYPFIILINLSPDAWSKSLNLGLISFILTKWLYSLYIVLINSSKMV